MLEWDPHALTSHPPSTTGTLATSVAETVVVKKPIHTVADDSAHVSTNHVDLSSDTTLVKTTQQMYSRLPKLKLPIFNGNPLQWQTFWDLFTAAVDSNPCPSQVQKLSYLRAQLQGDAAHVISGLPLIDSNYTHSVTLLRERFGQ